MPELLGVCNTSPALVFWKDLPKPGKSELPSRSKLFLFLIVTFQMIDDLKKKVRVFQVTLYPSFSCTQAVLKARETSAMR